MRTKNLLLTVLAVAALTGCNGGTSSSSAPVTSTKIAEALSSVKLANYEVDASIIVKVFKPLDPYAVDIYVEQNHHISYLYEGEERGYVKQSSNKFADLVKETGEINMDTFRISESEPFYCFKDLETGEAVVEFLNYQNELSTSIVANYDEDNGIYTPILFDNEFSNPFDYITERDFVENADGSLKLINSKADLIAKSYGLIGLNIIQDNKVNLNENNEIESIDFVIEDQEDETYKRTNSVSIEFTHSEDLVLEHLKPFTNDNPALATALKQIEKATNFTYNKTYYADTEYTEEIDRIMGYYTEDEVFFHHQVTENDEHPYRVGDDYDYKVEKAEDGIFYVYQYDYIADNLYHWNMVMLSNTTPYTFNSFDEFRPTFNTLSPAIFKKIDDRTYEIEEYFLSGVGKYFDHQVEGVKSLVFDRDTTKCIVHLDEQGNLDTIDTQFVFENVKYNVQFELENIGTTVIPSWVDVVD